MKTSIYKNYEELPLFLNAELVGKVLGIAPSSSYELMHVVGVSSASLASGQGRKLVRSAAPPLPTKPKDGFVGAPFDFLCAESWKPDGDSQGEICGVGRTTHQRR